VGLPQKTIKIEDVESVNNKCVVGKKGQPVIKTCIGMENEVGGASPVAVTSSNFNPLYRFSDVDDVVSRYTKYINNIK